MPIGEEASNTLLIEVNGSPLPAEVRELLTEGYIDDSSNVPDLFVLRFSDGASTVLEKSGIAIGTPLKLSVQASNSQGPAPLLSGEVTALETEFGTNGSQTIVRGLDHSHRLFRGRRVEAYLQCTATDIVRKVAARTGIKAGIIDAKGPVFQHVAQDGICDWDFLHRLAVDCGATLSVTNGALNFTASTKAADAPSGQAGARNDPLVIQSGVNLVSLRGTLTSADQVPDVEVRGWDVEAKKAIVSVAAAQTRSAKLAEADPVQLARKIGSGRFLAQATAFEDAAQCDAAAASLSSHLAGGFAELEGIVRGNPKLKSGTAISLTGVGKPFEGSYTLSSTRHEFSPHTGYQTWFSVSHESERSMYGVTAGADSHSGPVPAVVNAVVTATKDPENRGRVKVKFPVISDTYESWWARTVQVGAGNKRGAIVLPEVGDEVLVAFGHDSFQQPFVLGGLYNGKDMPDVGWSQHVGSTDGAVERRAFVSRTGMLVEFLESPSGESVAVSTNNGSQRITLTQTRDAGIEIVSEGAVTVTAKKDVVVTTSGGDMHLSATNISIDAKSALSLSGATVEVAGKSSAELSAARVTVSASAAAELSGGATTTVKGALVKIN